jgi:hypothetical protein
MKKIIFLIKKYRLWIGSIWGILTTILSFYLAFYPLEQNPELTFYQKSKLDLLAIDDPVEELKIVINGHDVGEKNLGLKVYKFKLINNGKKDIRKIDYAEEVPFGLQIHDGKMARIDVINTTNGVLSRNLINKQNNDSTKILFNKIFFGKQDYVILDIWVEYSRDKNPSLYPTGKIADTHIKLTDQQETTLKSWVTEWWPVALIIAGIFVGIYGATLISFLYRKTKEMTRRQIMRAKYDHHYDRSNKRHRLILKIYSLYGKNKFINLLNIFVDEDVLRKTFEEETSNEYLVEEYIMLFKSGKIQAGKSEIPADYPSDFLDTLGLLLEAELASIDENEEGDILSIDPTIREDMRFVLKLIGNS